MKNGFTLVELLAVIVVLSIIALIGFYSIGNVVETSEDNSNKITMENYAKAVDQAKIIYEMNNPDTEIVMNSGWIKENVKFEKATVKCESITNEKSINLYGCTINNSNKKYCYIDNKVIECEENMLAYKETILNGNDPDLLNNSLTPVVYDEAKSTWVVADIKKEWYNYSKQEWANAVILNSGVAKNVGDTVIVPTTSSTTSEVKAMFVWIPRYEYHIEGQYGTHLDGTAGTKALPGQIEIKFIPKSQTIADPNYILHPGFAWDTDNNGILATDSSITKKEYVSGIWVGKFKMTGTIDAPSVLPNTSMVRKQNLNNQFTASQMFSTYLSDGSDTDSHIVKNTEWGAMAYLSQSIYGKYGNTNYTGANKEVYKNTSTATGRSTGSYTGDSYVCVYDNISDRGNGTGSCGGGASTTGNITGIYDVSGGIYEFTMGYYTGAKNTQIWTNPGFTKQLEVKYTNAYTGKINSSTTLANSTVCNGNPCFGHAFMETAGWYNDIAQFGSVAFPWSIRGNTACGDDDCSGIFSISLDTGSGYTNSGQGSRPTLLLEP